MKKRMQWVMAAFLLLIVQGAWAQRALTTDAIIRVAEQKSKLEGMTVDGKKKSPAQQPTLTLVVKVADDGAKDTYARLREQGVTIRGRIGQQAIVQVPIDKVETIAQMDGILRVDVGHQGQLKTNVSREVTGVNVVSAGSQYVDSANGTTPKYIDTMTWQGYPYTNMSGTSMACPTVSGIIALWLQANPKLTLADVKDVLANSCDNDEFTAKDPIRWGYGKINAKKGLDYIQQASGIVEIEDVRGKMSDVWYTLDGRRLNGQPNAKGIYINNGIKVVCINH